MMEKDFVHTELGGTGIKVFRMGLSATYRPGKAAIYKAIDAGVNYFFLYNFDFQMINTLRDVLKVERDRYVISTGGYNFIWWRSNLRKVLEKRLRTLRVDHIDVFMFLGVMKEAHIGDDVKEELIRFKEEGKVRSIGISTHNRKLAGRLADEGVLDLLMVRYNAAHRGAEEEIFPRISKNNTAIVSYTATRWRRLLRRPRGWPADGRIPKATDCYRFVLGNPNVDLCLTAPSNYRQIEENLSSIELGPLPTEDLEFMRQFGDAVHKKSR
jgi:aryl-alcohol dehydrogenase-like predicted oxidoreductase